MNAGLRALATGALLAATFTALAGCRSITVVPEAARLPTVAAGQRRDVTFDLRYDRHLLALDPAATDDVVAYDGEDLYVEAQRVRDALVATGAFADVRRARTPRADTLHCDLHVRYAFDAGTQLMSIVLTAGVAPDRHRGDLLLEAVVRAPGRTQARYAFRTESVTWIWVPLLPIGLGQLALQRPPLQQTVDALVAQLAADGLLAAER